ncbi:hypothetical protein LJE72_11265 [Desulfosporosinus sp. SRJS8]|nr:hypothetical protein [Desulfosporosinus sp. SRJS8]MCB8816101.1 hypothetical protein [Desulfosporosinus sp. SRJS8]
MAGLSPEETKYQDYVEFMFQVKQNVHLHYVYVSKFTPFKGIAIENHPALFGTGSGKGDSYYAAGNAGY